MLTRRSLLAGLALAPIGLDRSGAAPASAYDFSFPGIDGQPLRLADHRGQPMLVVNTASRCGYTYQYTALQKLYDTYRARGLMVIGVPSNDFHQELADGAAVKNFCEVNFNIDFPLTDLVSVTGKSAHPFYQWAAASLGAKNTPRWNFHKYLVGPDGALVTAFGTGTEPMAREVIAAIEPLLPQG